MAQTEQGSEASGPISLQQQAARLLALLRPLLADPLAAIPLRLTASLFDFYISAQERQTCIQAGETARALASLLHNRGDNPLREQEQLQVAVLIDTLVQDLAPRYDEAGDEHRPLVTPVPPSLANVNARVAVCVDHAALRFILREALAAASFDPVVFDTLDALAGVTDVTVPAAMVVELGLCRLDPRASAIFANLRDRFSPPPHLVCIALAEDTPARLDAVRLGATRVLGLPIDAARLISVLKGITLQVPHAPFSVVLVDDDPFLAEICRDGLEEAGIRVWVAHDPVRAPALIRDVRPDLVLCDIFMPGCNGLELLALLRQDDDFVETPIVLLSSDPGVARRLEALNLGADDFLMKPVDMSLLVSVVLARARRSRTLRRSRGELHRLRERVKALEAARYPDAFLPAGTIVDFEGNAETINLDDYVVSVVEAGGKRGWARGGPTGE